MTNEHGKIRNKRKVLSRMMKKKQFGQKRKVRSLGNRIRSDQRRNFLLPGKRSQGEPPPLGWSDIKLVGDFRKRALCCPSGPILKIGKFGHARAAKYLFPKNYLKN